MDLGTPVTILRMFDEDQTREFYLGFLGFSLDWEHRFGDSFPLYMQVSKDGCVIHLSGHYGDCCPGGAIRIPTRSVQQYCDLLLSKNFSHSRPGCQTTEWQTLEMTLQDPAGNRLIFAEQLQSSPAC